MVNIISDLIIFTYLLILSFFVYNELLLLLFVWNNIKLTIFIIRIIYFNYLIKELAFCISLFFFLFGIFIKIRTYFFLFGNSLQCVWFNFRWMIIILFIFVIIIKIIWAKAESSFKSIFYFIIIAIFLYCLRFLYLGLAFKLLDFINLFLWLYFFGLRNYVLLCVFLISILYFIRFIIFKWIIFITFLLNY